MAPQKKKDSNFLLDFALGGVSGAIAKTCTAPIERVKLIIQTQDANPRIKSGEVPRYTGIMNCFTRVYQEQGLAAFWRGNVTNVIRYFPTQAFNFAFKDQIKAMFPKVCCRLPLRITHAYSLPAACASGTPMKWSVEVSPGSPPLKKSGFVLLALLKNIFVLGVRSWAGRDRFPPCLLKVTALRIFIDSF